MAKKRPRLGRGRVYTPEESAAYEKFVGLRARNAGALPRKDQVAIAILVITNRRGDLDNWIKSVLDGLNRVAFVDDSQVRVIYAAKSRLPERNLSQEGIYVIIHYLAGTDK